MKLLPALYLRTSWNRKRWVVLSYVQDVPQQESKLSQRFPIPNTKGTTRRSSSARGTASNWETATITTWVTRCCSIDIATMSAMPSSRKPKGYASDWQTQVSISNDHTLKSRMMGNYHVRVGSGSGGSNPSADHKSNRGFRKVCSSDVLHPVRPITSCSP